MPDREPAQETGESARNPPLAEILPRSDLSRSGARGPGMASETAGDLRSNALKKSPDIGS